MSAQPSRRLGKEEQGDEKDEARNTLNTPRDPEGSRATDESAAVADEVHDEHAPLDGPLLYTHDAASDASRGELSKVNTDLGAGDADRETRDQAADDELSDVLGGTLDGGTDDPYAGCEHEGFAATPAIRDVACGKCSEEGTSGHGGGDAALGVGVWIVEVCEVLVGIDPSAHGADIESEECTTDSAKCGEHCGQ